MVCPPSVVIPSQPILLYIHFNPLFPFTIKGSLKGLRPFKTSPSPSPFKERGIKGVRLLNPS